MDFGRVSAADLKKTDLSLPKDPPGNKRILEKARKTTTPKIYVGCAKWGRKEWVGKIYPPKTKEAQFLDEYLRHYNSIELNATHYRVNLPDIRKWAEKAKGHAFLFCPKVPQSISHFSAAFQNPKTQPQLDDFLAAVSEFKKNLGPIFLQVSDKFGPKKKKELFDFLATLPKDVQWFFEARHREWFADANEKQELFKTLTKLKIGAVITDTAGRRDCCHMHLTTPTTFIRFVGNSLHPTDYTRIDEWVRRIKKWLDNGLRELYFFMHMHDEAYSPELSLYLAEQLNKKCGVNLVKPVFVKKPLSKQKKTTRP
jgi:uncharacterized protein YecE (DUF72 family)